MQNIRKYKPIWIGGIIAFFLTLVGIIGSLDSVCSWNPVEGSVVPTGICTYLAILYYFHFGSLLIANLLVAQFFIVMENFFKITPDIYWSFVRIVSLIIGTFIGILVGYFIYKRKQKSV